MKRVPKKRNIYLDHAATTPIDNHVLKEMHKTSNKYYGNPSSLHSFGIKSNNLIKKSRISIAKILNTKPENIIFTGSGTESDNLAIFGIANKYKNFGKHIVTSKIEHKAVLNACSKLEKNGFEISYVDVDKDGIIDLNQIKNSLRKDTILVSIIYANNEIGTIQPIKKISKIIREHKRESSEPPFFHVDACQAAGALSLDVSLLKVDLLTLNGSKIYGPRGIGCLYKAKDVSIEPMIIGGGQERGIRAGTENTMAIVGFEKALKISDSKRKKEEIRLSKLRDYFFDEILKTVPNCKINGHISKRLPNNINISFLGVEGESIVLMLDKYGIYASTGSACAAHDLSPSHVISALDDDPLRAHGSIRLSLGRDTKMKDIKYVLAKLPPIIKNLREISAIKIK